MLNTPFSPWPSFSGEEVEAVASVLSSNRVNYRTGEECRHLERKFAAWTGTEHAIALTNGTVALDLALNALNVGPGAEVVVTPRTFLASVSCVVNAGAAPVFADVDRDSGNITADTISAVLTERTKAIMLFTWLAGRLIWIQSWRLLKSVDPGLLKVAPRRMGRFTKAAASDPLVTLARGLFARTKL